MKERLILLNTLMKRIGDFSMNSFEGRLKFQKRVYLLKAIGFGLNYNFSWFIRGPYSPELTDDGFEIFMNQSKINERKLNEHEEKDLGEFMLLTKGFDTNEIEALASLHFLKKIYAQSKEKTISRLIEIKKHLNKNICETSWNRLEKFNLV